MLGPVIEEVAAEVDDAKICKVDVDQCISARQYKVVSIPMLVVARKREVDRKAAWTIIKKKYYINFGNKKEMYTNDKNGIVMEDLVGASPETYEYILQQRDALRQIIYWNHESGWSSHADGA